MKLFPEAGVWRKGNLHTHTSASDGAVSIEESIARYRAAGYDFMAITDHHVHYPGLETRDFVVLPAVELHNNSFGQPRVCYHITGVGLKTPVDLPPQSQPQEMIDRIHAAGGFATLAHPAWSLMTVEEVAALQGLDAIEIYNGVSDVYSGRGDSAVYLDVLAARGQLCRLTAVDDTHYYKGDLFQGYVMVKTESNTAADILQGLYDNAFYATQGPELFQITLEDGEVSVETSPLESITFYTDSFYAPGRTLWAEGGVPLTRGSYRPIKWDHVLRIEGRDFAGRRVWSNYISLEKPEETVKTGG